MTKLLNNVDVTGYISQTSVSSSLLKTDSNGKLVAAVAGTDYQTPTALASADRMVTVGRNATGATLYKGTIVYISGSTGNRPNFVKAQANSEATSAGTFGVVYADIPNNSDGNVVNIGVIDTLDTRSIATNPFTADTLADGDTIYLSPTTAGYVTNVKPSAPNHLVYVGKVTRTSPTNGTIVYRIQNGYELDEIHNVAISSVANNQGIFWESATSLWKNKTIATVLGYTPVDASLTTNYIPKATGATSLGNSLIYDSGTKIGINTSTINSAVAQIHTDTDISVIDSESQYALWVSQTSVSKGLILGYSNTFNAGVIAAMHTGVAWKNLILNPFAGNVLIGTSTNAGYKLDVNGTGRFSNKLTTATAASDTTGAYALALNGDYAGLRLGTDTSFNVDVYKSGTGFINPFKIYSNGDSFFRYNVGLGVTPSAWGSNWRAIEYSNGVYLTALSGSTTPIMILGANAYYDNTNFIYKNTAAATRYQQDSGVHYWYNAPSGTAGTTVTFTQAMTLFASGNLAIGSVADAGYKLDVNGTGRFSGTITGTADLTLTSTGGHTINMVATTAGSQTISMTALGGGSNTVTGTGGDLNIQTTGAYPLVFKTNNAEALRIASGGAATFSSSVTANQIGIGVTSLPTWTGAKAIQAGLAGSFYGDGLVYGWQTGMAANAYRTGAITWAYGNSGVVATRVEMSEINPFSIFIAPSGTAGNTISFTQAFTLTSSGNVGIGTTAPSYKLDVYSSDVLVSRFGGSQGSATALQLFNSTQSITLYKCGASAFGISEWVNNAVLESDTGITYSAYNGAHIFMSAVNGRAERMRITSGGNVLIGTTTDAGYKLDVNGTGRFSGALTLSTALTLDRASLTAATPIRFSTAGTNDWFIGESPLGTSTSDLFFYSYGTSSSVFTLAKSTGAATFSSSVTAYTSITVSNNGAESSLLGATSNYADGYDAILQLNNTHTGGRTWRLLSTNNSRGTLGGGKLVFQDTTAGSNTAVMTLVTGGNVGIGTTSPATLLHISSSNTVLQIQSTSVANNANLRFVTTARTWTIGPNQYLSDSSFEIVDSTAGSPRIVIPSSGNVLIGTTTDSGYKLQVAGGSLFNGAIRMNSNSGGMDLNRDSTSGYVGVSYKSADAYKWFVGMRENTATSNYVIYNYTNAADVLTLNVSTNAATFSSSVTATSFFESSSVAYKNILATNPLTSLNVDVIKYKRTNVDVDDVRYGYSAEQINSLMPELTNKEVTAVKYLDVHTLLIAELQREIKELKARLN